MLQCTHNIIYTYAYIMCNYDDETNIMFVTIILKTQGDPYKLKVKTEGNSW